MKKVNAEHGLGTGKGDCVCLCWLPDCEFYVEDAGKKEIFKLFGAKITDEIKGCVRMEKAFHKDLQGLSRRPRLDSWRKALNIEAEPVRPKAHIAKGSLEWAARQTKDQQQPIMLFPLTNVISRQWPISYWIDLAWTLKYRGERPLIFLPNEDSRFGRAPNVWHGFSFNHICAMMLLSKCVIGCDSLPAHLAGTLDVPTYVCGGPTGESVYSHCKSVMVMQSCITACVGCCFKPPFRAACDSGCQALYTLTPDQVLGYISVSV